MKKLIVGLACVSIISCAMEQKDQPDTPPGKKNTKTEQGQQVPVIVTEATVATFPQAHFSPNIDAVINNLIDHEKERIVGAQFRFTLYNMAQALVKKNVEKVTSTIIVDKEFNKDFCAAIRLLIKNKIPVYQQNKKLERAKPGDIKYDNLHHKFFIFYNNITHKSLLVTGSFNCSGQANARNAENIVILDDAPVIEKFITEMNLLLTKSTPIKIEECVCTATNKTPAGKQLNNIPDDVDN